MTRPPGMWTGKTLPGRHARRIDIRDQDGAWRVERDVLMQRLDTSPAGLSSHDAATRLARDGANVIETHRHQGTWRLLARQFADPIVVLLVAAALMSLGLGQVVDATIILAIVMMSGLLGFVQERRAGHAMRELASLVRVFAEVRRDGRVMAVPLAQVVVGDVIELNAGDLVPCDGRVLEATDLLVDTSTLTGESYPAHKTATQPQLDLPLTARPEVLLYGTHVVSGRGVAVAVATGRATHFGHLARGLEDQQRRSSFQRGVGQFGLLIARVTLLLALVILAVNIVVGRDAIDAVLFSLALAVGLTPQMLPVIVSVSLATGARQMAARNVIVRRLEAIEDFGSMDVLCTDKTGTLTEGQLRLEMVLDAAGNPNIAVGRLAAMNAGLQLGFANPLDVAIMAGQALPPNVQMIDEIPFDFTRKRLGVLADHDATRELIVKGAVDSVLEVCSTVDISGELQAIDRYRSDITRRFETLSRHGWRVLGIATVQMPETDHVSVADETDMVFRGLLVFGDPPKADARDAVQRLRDRGVSTRMLTGDNRFAARHVASRVGLDTTAVVTGSELAVMDHDRLRSVVRSVEVFAELDPLGKQRVIAALRDEGVTVGYLGDGINDAAALRAADVGISVDTAVDVAKHTASIVLLDKDLSVLAEGIELGRQTFANTLKYVFTTVSANFGNVASIAIASAFLPFLPLLPRQILLLNFLSDIPSATIAGDRVDDEQRENPQHWNIRLIRDFMVTFGLVSTAFDLLTFAVLLQVFNASPTEFRTGWFVV